VIGKRVLCCALAGLVGCLPMSAPTFAAEEPSDELVQMVVDLIGDADKDVRAVGLEQVRSEAKGANATRRFAERLPKLSPEAQVGLLSALADRGDKASRSAVLALIQRQPSGPVRTAAIAALGPLGEAGDLPVLLELLAADDVSVQQAARGSLVRVQGDGLSQALATAMRQAAPKERIALIEILASRRALDAIPQLLEAAVANEPTVRGAAMSALGQLADPSQIDGLVRGVLRADSGGEREAAEKAVAQVLGRIKNPDERAAPLLAVLETLPDGDRLLLLPTLGRVGGADALPVIEAAIADTNPQRHEAGMRAIANWPNAAISGRLIQLVESEADAQNRRLALAALIRVAPLPDKRPSQEKLDLLAKALTLCTNTDEQNLILKRASAIRAIETLRFVLPYLDQAPFARQAAETVVELAHHRGLREPNKAEFDEALDRVIKTSTDATVIDRAQRYKRGQTWTRPAAGDKS